MALTHNYINTVGFKPTALEASQAELIVNLADGTLWSENTVGTVIQIGGGSYTGGTGITITGTSIAADTHTGGDVTGDVNLTIGAGVVDLAMLADINTQTFIGRTTAALGVPEELSATAARAILNVEDGAEVNNISDVNAGLLVGGINTTLHFHDSDRDRTNHTGTQLAATISDFQTTVTANTDVAASKVVTDWISVTQAVDLDAIETRVNELDASVVLMGEWDASVGDFPDALNTTPALAVAIVSGMSWIVGTTGTVNGVVFTANDRIIALVDAASNTIYAGNWHKADYTDEVLSVGGNGTTAQIGVVTLDPDDFDDSATTNKFVTAADLTTLGNLTGTNSGDQNLFSTIAVATQTDIVADTLSDTLTMVGGTGITITTNAATDELTITSTASGTTNLVFENRTTTQYEITSSSGGNAIVTGATGALAGAMVSADKTKLDFITVTQAVNLNSGLLTGESV